MAKSKIPNPLERRHLIEKDLTAAQALGIAEAYLEVGRVVESLDFLSAADAQDRLAEIRQQAIETGDAFLLRSVGAATGRAPNQHEWEGLAAAATRAGRELYAIEARRQAERGSD